MNRDVLRHEERAIYDLRDLYSRYGYTQFKMSKFEEYDLYVKNKDFLISDSVITFTDTDGKLMALKPDVTLSIVKNSRDVPGQVQKLYYDENVYRVAGGSHSFREIRQAGLECIGAVDDYCVGEVLLLAAESLRTVASSSVLAVSHLGVLDGVVRSITEDPALRGELLRCAGEKNLHDMTSVCVAAGLAADAADPLKKLLTAYGKPSVVLPAIRELADCVGIRETVDRLERILSIFDGTELVDRIQLDFSEVGDLTYYNGIVFKGYAEGLPGSILSGGQYDGLMRRMGRKAGAIGFAVYLDQLERLREEPDADDVDVVLLYDDTADMAQLQRAVASLIEGGESVFAGREIPAKLRCRRVLNFENGKVKPGEIHA